MGGLSSRPTAPQVQYVVQQPVSPPVTEQASSTDTQTPSEASAEIRENDLLRRQRGRTGTILTGFTGLNNNDDDLQSQVGRKTLLGE